MRYTQPLSEYYIIFFSYAFPTARAQMKLSLEVFGGDGPHCGCRQISNRLETSPVSFVSTFTGHIAVSSYTSCSMCNLSLRDLSKFWQSLMFERCFSNSTSDFDERERLQFTDMHCLEKPCTVDLLLPHDTCASTPW